MNIDQLIAALDRLSWEEQVQFEHGDTVSVDFALLALQLTPADLDQLAQHPGYIGWSLRLSPMVPGDDSRRRALSYLDSPDPDVRYWAARLLDP